MNEVFGNWYLCAHLRSQCLQTREGASDRDNGVSQVLGTGVSHGNGISEEGVVSRATSDGDNVSHGRLRDAATH